MQFKHPEILWALFLLVIPVVIHLFQLRRFTKTPFTNVAMLQKVVSESRKSNTLKKWLLLFTRLFLLAAIIIAFAQPFNAMVTALKEKETVIYLDDSFSMQVRENGLSLLEKAVQDLIKNLDGETSLSLFTNERTFRDITIKDIQNTLLSLPYASNQLDLKEIGLKANTLFSTSNATAKNLIVISDFQQRIFSQDVPLDSTITTHYVPLTPRDVQNVSIDSISISEELSEQASLEVYLSRGEQGEALPISLYNGQELIAKTASKFSPNGKSKVVFSIPAHEEIKGRLVVTDNGLAYDNTFYFNINAKEKIKVVAISGSDSDYLDRLYTDDEFELTKSTINQLDYSLLNSQNVVVMDNLKTIPSNLQEVLRNFRENGGTLIMVPSMDSDASTYNALLSSLEGTQFGEQVNVESKVTTIAYDHPLYRNVFENEVTNFQYPTVKEYFKIQSKLPKILSLEGGDAFLSGRDGLYIFSASLEQENSNFKNSPLIVPAFYNMALSSLQSPDLYHTLGRVSFVDIATRLGADDILKVSKEGYEFIPLQQAFPNRVRLTFDENPTTDGLYAIQENGETLKNISFNYPREESQLNYLDLSDLQNVNTQESISSLFDLLEAENNITAYWKWFVILALLLALIEVVIQKFVT